MSEEYRYEIKFILNDKNYSVFMSWLGYETTAYKRYEDRLINSLYFDDISFTSVKDNLSGVGYRSKTRLRWYGDKNKISGVPTLEKKIRSGRLGTKEYLPIKSLEDEINLLSLKEIIYRTKKESEKDPLQIASLHPTLLTSYKREYYEDNYDLRITLDNHVTYALPLIKKKIYENYWIKTNKRILEFKFTPRQKNYVARTIRNLNLVPVRHSKYLAGLSAHGMANYI